jgi:hypothetical protein
MPRPTKGARLPAGRVPTGRPSAARAPTAGPAGPLARCWVGGRHRGARWDRTRLERRRPRHGRDLGHRDPPADREHRASRPAALGHAAVHQCRQRESWGAKPRGDARTMWQSPRRPRPSAVDNRSGGDNARLSAPAPLPVSGGCATVGGRPPASPPSLVWRVLDYAVRSPGRTTTPSIPGPACAPIAAPTSETRNSDSIGRRPCSCVTRSAARSAAPR